MLATRPRTDPHRPSAIDPADYEYVGIEYMKTEDIGELFMLAEERDRIRRHQKRTGAPYSRHRHGGNCHICGAHCIYTALFYHVPGNVYIRTGFDCAEKMDLGDPVAFRAIKEAVKSAREAIAGKQKTQITLQDAGLSRAWELYHLDDTDPLTRNPGYSTLCDLVGKLCRYGWISEKAEDYLRTLTDRIDRASEIEAERAAEKAAAAPCPTGRVVVEGEVLKTEWRDSAYGGALKMTVKAAGGWLCWGTAPAALTIVEEPRELDGDTWTVQRGLHRGDRVRFTATLTPSDRDDKFGFFKRPSKAEIVKAVTTAD